MYIRYIILGGIIFLFLVAYGCGGGGTSSILKEMESAHADTGTWVAEFDPEGSVFYTLNEKDNSYIFEQGILIPNEEGECTLTLEKKKYIQFKGYASEDNFKADPNSFIKEKNLYYDK